VSDTPKLRIIFDGPPAHESGRFVEVEDEAGGGVRVGEWVADKEPYWALVIDDPRALRSRIATLEARLTIEGDNPFPEGYDALDLANDRIRLLEAQVEQAREALEDFANSGIRHDLHPTMHEGNTATGSQVGYSVGFVYGYLDRADKSIRERAKAALQALREGGKG